MVLTDFSCCVSSVDDLTVLIKSLMDLDECSFDFNYDLINY